MEIKAQDPPVAGAPIGEPGAGDMQRAVEEADVRERIRAGEQFIEELSRNAEKSHEQKSGDSRETKETKET